MNDDIVNFIRDIYKTKQFIPLHAPTFSNIERKYVLETIDSTYVSSVGAFVHRFEEQVGIFTGTAKAVATVNGTAALHVALYAAGVRANDLVITQALTFVATCNALYHMGAKPVFLDVDRETLSLSPNSVKMWLENNAERDEKGCRYKYSGQTIKAIVPMHTFGHPARLDELSQICNEWGIALVEDAAESLGSFYKGKHTGTYGCFSALSFNGNKIITTGGGGMVLCKDLEGGKHVKHITTTAKQPHPYEFYHDEPGFNYRLPNINAALGCAQMEKLNTFLELKRELAQSYHNFFENSEVQCVKEPSYAQSNYWLNAIICPDKEYRDEFIRITNSAEVMTRPIWQLMHRLPMFSSGLRDDLQNSQWLEERVVNLPSTPVELSI
ncbi:LegC family aminotransferase [Pantoea sp. FN0305]|uniref:LegC family aminotransferase n=1 Tax=Pantoea sp. FN0305 TaxID=3418559 RepID=UPI003CF9D2A9